MSRRSALVSNCDSSTTGALCLLTTNVSTGTFARVWLANLVTSRKEDADKVFALKILRKTDGASSCVVLAQKIRSDKSCSDPLEASRTCSQRAQCPSRRGRTPIHHNNGRQFPRPRHSIHAGKSLFTSMSATRTYFSPLHSWITALVVRFLAICAAPAVSTNPRHNSTPPKSSSSSSSCTTTKVSHTAISNPRIF